MDRARAEAYPLRRREVVASLIGQRTDLLLVGGLGAPSNDIAAVGDRPNFMPLWGAMGGAAMIGMGLALAQPSKRVLVITGDGEMLMGMGALATIAVKAPGNLSIVVLDNERYGETGGQTTHTSARVDLCGVAEACGIRVVGKVVTAAELEAAKPAILEFAGPCFHVIKVKAEQEEMILPPKDGHYLRDRFRTAVLGAEAAKL
ncbi:thiamine pyrophosphate-dependent enzyme [Desertibaculum subflavum]|uniref:thiamine pyrophosphate-dependent enzyme n=1 Tax=Desertibaculum subflavum TaxID=2268458 RepID=UPI000E661E95